LRRGCAGSRLQLRRRGIQPTRGPSLLPHRRDSRDAGARWRGRRSSSAVTIQRSISCLNRLSRYVNPHSLASQPTSRSALRSQALDRRDEFVDLRSVQAPIFCIGARPDPAGLSAPDSPARRVPCGEAQSTNPISQTAAIRAHAHARAVIPKYPHPGCGLSLAPRPESRLRAAQLLPSPMHMSGRPRMRGSASAAGSASAHDTVSSHPALACTPNVVERRAAKRPTAACTPRSRILISRFGAFCVLSRPFLLVRGRDERGRRSLPPSTPIRHHPAAGTERQKRRAHRRCPDRGRGMLASSGDSRQGGGFAPLTPRLRVVPRQRMRIGWT
jgi:hypothetical protein